MITDQLEPAVQTPDPKMMQNQLFPNTEPNALKLTLKLESGLWTMDTLQEIMCSLSFE